MAGPEQVGDYLLFPAFANGGMATIHFGRLVRDGGFQRLVVVKRLLPMQAQAPGAADRLFREARLSSRVRSPFVVPAIDVVCTGRELCLVMDYVHGVTLARFIELAVAAGRPLPLGVVSAIFGETLRGLHAAHEATGEDGSPLGIVHRDVTPRNVMVGADGLARVLDFGIAKALGQRGALSTGDVHGTLAYMAPEQFQGKRVITRHADVFSAGVMLWEALVGRRVGADPESGLGPMRVEGANLPPPSRERTDVPSALDAVVARATRAEPSDRFGSAEEMALAIEAAVPPASREELVRVIEDLAFEDLDALRERARECETVTTESAGTQGTSVAPAPAVAAEAPPSRRFVPVALVAVVAVAGALGVVYARTPTTAPRAPAAAPPPPSVATSSAPVAIETPQALTPATTEVAAPPPRASETPRKPPPPRPAVAAPAPKSSAAPVSSSPLRDPTADRK